MVFRVSEQFVNEDWHSFITFLTLNIWCYNSETIQVIGTAICGEIIGAGGENSQKITGMHYLRR